MQYFPVLSLYHGASWLQSDALVGAFELAGESKKQLLHWYIEVSV